MMLRNRVTLLPLLIILNSTAFSQSQKIIDSLHLEIQKLKKIAIPAKKEADRIRYLSIARDVAEVSLEIHDPEQAKLLAIHSYQFNSKYDGYTYDSKIHIALTKALENLRFLPRKIENTFKSYQRIMSPSLAPFLLCVGKDKLLTKLSQQESEWRIENVLQLNSSFLIETAVVNDNGDLFAVGKDSGVIEVYD